DLLALVNDLGVVMKTARRVLRSARVPVCSPGSVGELRRAAGEHRTYLPYGSGSERKFDGNRCTDRGAGAEPRLGRPDVASAGHGSAVRAAARPVRDDAVVDHRGQRTA